MAENMEEVKVVIKEEKFSVENKCTVFVQEEKSTVEDKCTVFLEEEKSTVQDKCTVIVQDECVKDECTKIPGIVNFLLSL